MSNQLKRLTVLTVGGYNFLFESPSTAQSIYEALSKAANVVPVHLELEPDLSNISCATAPAVPLSLNSYRPGVHTYRTPAELTAENARLKENRLARKPGEAQEDFDL